MNTRIHSEERPVSLLKTRKSSLQIENISRRLTFFVILMIGLLGGIIFLSYHGLKKRFYNIDRSGDIKVQELSQDIESKYERLTVKYKKLEKSLDGIKKLFQTKVEPINQTIRSLEAKSAQTTKSLAKLNKHINQTLKKNHTQLMQLEEHFKTLEVKLTEKLTTFGTVFKGVNTEVKTLRTDITNLGQSKVEQKFFDRILKKQQLEYRQEMELIIGNLSNKQKSIDSILKTIRDMEKMFKDQKTVTKPTPLNKIPPPGKFIEQDIE